MMRDHDDTARLAHHDAELAREHARTEADLQPPRGLRQFLNPTDEPFTLDEWAWAILVTAVFGISAGVVLGGLYLFLAL